MEPIQLRRLHGLRRNMTRRRQVQRHAVAVYPPLLQDFIQLAGEIDIPRLIARRVCVGDIGGQYFLALGAQVQRLLAKTQSSVQFVEHAPSARLEFGADSINAPCANLSQE